MGSQGVPEGAGGWDRAKGGTGRLGGQDLGDQLKMWQGGGREATAGVLWQS